MIDHNFVTDCVDIFVPIRIYEMVDDGNLGL